MFDSDDNTPNPSNNQLLASKETKEINTLCGVWRPFCCLESPGLFSGGIYMYTASQEELPFETSFHTNDQQRNHSRLSRRSQMQARRYWNIGRRHYFARFHVGRILSHGQLAGFLTLWAPMFASWQTHPWCNGILSSPKSNDPLGKHT